MLGRSQIESAIDIGDIEFEGTVRRSALLLRLGPCLRKFKSEPKVIDPYDRESVQNSYGDRLKDWTKYKLYSGELILCTALETVGFENKYGGFICGLSHVARLGLFVHCASDVVDPGFEGKLTFELYNASPNTLLLREDMPVAKVVVVDWHENSNFKNHRIRYGAPKRLGSRFSDEFSQR
jgi:deoxycytidine triphosphate deaminase